MNATNSLKRKRSRKACMPCRHRKRKCDGGEPCTTCVEWGYDCSYKNDSKPGTLPAPEQDSTHYSGKQNSVLPEVAEPGPAASGASVMAQHLEANSGAAFVRKIGLKIDPTRAPKLSLFAWNVGVRELSFGFNPIATQHIREITSLKQIKVLTQVYLEKLDPCYGFIDRLDFEERLEIHWNAPASMDVYDSVICSIAAIGCLFSQRNATITELQLANTAQSILSNYRLVGPPHVDLLTGWLLRTIYLRLTDLPHSTWVASCTLMHLIEASGIYPESASTILHDVQYCPPLASRLIGVATHLNAWTSFDLGLSRVSFHDDNLPDVSPTTPGDYTIEILRLLPISISLDPGKPVEKSMLSSKLQQIMAGNHVQPPSVLAQCNLVLCILRHIYSYKSDLSYELAEQAVSLLNSGLECARKMAIECCPWHQVANVPFQTICILLAMDTRSSLAVLPQALEVLNLTASLYPTEMMKDASKTVQLLLLLYQRRRMDDIAIFGEALAIPQQERITTDVSPINFGPEENSWLGALFADLPGLTSIDLDQSVDTEFFPI
ncbi:Zn2/Cys6 DNA-binding protein [Glarea lozoyensis ATCC 20868]|uniref:Zn2/Cys6 DNA-binding protein n=1 Tax=Glarea lozoyensis (strain ATCC 20868 / MF5171) TaxID=1116229 RepID=S3DJC7_GLAL2|nr:Zn2/Cys6 DNA-binding protein [Glarea lozoyensis ATCC 20868]EPE32146.1 Zn2/Cys6 DNA-binding protein [Glarea lozoyensis ATCC 20868]